MSQWLTHTFKLLHCRTYTLEARALAQLLVKSGASQRSVGGVIQKMTSMMGAKVDHCMSQQMVACTVLEGGVAAQIQLAHKITQMKSEMALRIGSTTHRHINYESRHVTMRVSEYENPPHSHINAVAPIPKMCLIGVDTSVDHTSETQVAGWKQRMSNLSEICAISPLAQHSQQTFNADNFVLKLKGMNGDHAEDQKKPST
ncbi:hypothetical protein WOLCODRAFT_90250 [Wolfiporia cocos MD-104 SS10]|uniref:Uncharacterized protein n=1 Tax=Wolfiporia cocos (strain MD-104) TaxID=742152 RepID=A0A2H3JPB6_WOLCO|nr:hypothetical protein WOLCODRAFT_90250 [Wolfiporia cocos MD-104 SS10]